MIVSGKCRDYNDKLDSMIQSVVVNNSYDIDLNDDKALYDRIVYLLINGSLNYELNSEHVNNLDYNTKKDVFNTVKRFSSLCLKEKNIYKWTNSCQGVIPSDYRYCCIRIIDNYDLLINMVINCGERSLKLIDNFSIYNKYKEYSVLEVLRNRFDFDDIMMKIIKDMSDLNSKFNTFSIEQKALLCYYASDILYTCNDNIVRFKSPNSIALDIYRYVYGTSNKPSLEELETAIRAIPNFEEVLINYIYNKN